MRIGIFLMSGTAFFCPLACGYTKKSSVPTRITLLPSFKRDLDVLLLFFPTDHFPLTRKPRTAPRLPRTSYRVTLPKLCKARNFMSSTADQSGVTRSYTCVVRICTSGLVS